MNLRQSLIQFYIKNPNVATILNDCYIRIFDARDCMALIELFKEFPTKN